MKNTSEGMNGRSYTHLTVQNIWQMIESVIEFENWHEIGDLLTPKREFAEQVSLDWQLPAIGYHLLTNRAEDVTPAIAAMACAQLAIIIADDILDEEPGSLYSEIGVGRATNISMALHAAAHLLLGRCNVTDEGVNSAHTALGAMVLATAQGQELDATNLTTEVDYWRVVRAKSAPYYGTGLEIGARLALADKDTSANFYAIGTILGEMIQIRDDLEDAFQVPANPDWLQGRNNLAILYALSANHAEKNIVTQLRSEADERSTLQRLQQILITSGAVSYCIFQLHERNIQIQELLGAVHPENVAKIAPLIESLLEPVRRFQSHIESRSQTKVRLT